MSVPTPRWRRTPATVRGVRFDRSTSARRSLGNALRTARRESGLTQAELGLAAGTCETTVASIESGRTWPRVDTLAALAVALDASLFDLVGV